MTNEKVPNLRTVGVLATEVGEPLHRVLYVLRTRPQIRPAARAGRLRLYDSDAVEQVRSAIRLMAGEDCTAEVSQ